MATSSCLPEKMHAVEILKAGGPDMLRPVLRPIPTPSPDEVLIEVCAAGINRPDILQRLGLYPPPEGASDLPGLEVSGTIIALGAKVTNRKLGDKVCALLSGGGYAQYAVAHQDHCMTIPDTLSLKDAAGLPETMITVWANMMEDGHLKSGETVLIHGGTSGIGMTAIAMAKAIGAEIITTAGNTEKCVYLSGLNLKSVFNYNEDDWETHINNPKIGGVDVVLDMTGGDFYAKNVNCLKSGGRHVSIAFLRGNKAEIDIFSLMRKRLTLTGSTLRARDIKEKARLCLALQTHIWPFFTENKLFAQTHTSFPLAQAHKAHELMESGQHIGKILLEIGSS